jgi:drug/metabolite transporter (DMT)-like permease
MTERDGSWGRRRQLGGVALSLAAAGTFGVLAPAAKGALAHLSPMRAAGLAYLAAGLVALLGIAVRALAGGGRSGRAVKMGDAPRLAGMTVVGGVLGSLLFFAGVARVEAHQAAVVQHLEFVLTILAAMLLLGERVGGKGYRGLALIGGGLLLFSLTGIEAAGLGGSYSWVGILLLVAACASWAVDNTLARGASELDPLVVVSIKGIGAGGVLLLATLGDGLALEPRAWLLVFLAGGVGVGVSLIFELLALRRIGATLNAGLFATGPAFGFVWSLLFLSERAEWVGWTALILCALGAISLSTDRHAHLHVHEPVRHSHPHGHVDGHHTHDHGPDFDPATVHEHEHEHGRMEHSHPHVHDEHHRHKH